MFGKKTEIISKKIKNLDIFHKFSSYLDRNVYSKSGEYVGRVYDILFDSNNLQGVMVSGRKRNIFIGKEFFGSESANAIVLNIEPVINLIGKQVYDAVGKRVGTVIEVKRKSNSNLYSDLIVKKAIYRRAFAISKKDIAIAKKNIILKKAHES